MKKITVKEAARTLQIRILRHNPHDPHSTPHPQTFELEEAESMTLFIALNEIRQTQDPSLQFDFVCRAGICGSCGMIINGRPGLACRTLTRDLPECITLAPLPGFALIGDLSVDTGKWMRGMSEQLETWVHQRNLDLAEKIYELERCIECGCCIVACGTARMHEDFVGAVGLNQITRFQLDPRDERTDADFYTLGGDESGVFGCMTLLGCEDYCPKDLPLAAQIAFLRRRMVAAAS